MRLLLTTLLLQMGFLLSAQKTDMQIRLDKPMLMPGDSIGFDAHVPQWEKEGRDGTLNIWMENTKGKSWRMRYPVMKGRAEGELVLPKDLTTGLYAAYFALQDDFFDMHGTVTSEYKDKKMKMIVMVGDAQIAARDIAINDDRTFRTGKLLFADEARVYFSPAKTNRINDLDLDISVSLDSTFAVLADTTTFFSVGSELIQPPPVGINRNPFEILADTGTLASVEVLGKRKTAVEKFAAEHESGIFRAKDAYYFDGIENPQFVGFNNILEWLPGRVPGLVIRRTGTALGYAASWQGSETFFFLNEMQVDAQTIATIPPADIAMIKVFRPPFYGAYLGGAGGAVAVYTKNGNNGDGGPRNKFVVRGYTPASYAIPADGN